MPKYNAKISWKRQTPDFAYETFDRTHTVTYNGGISVSASSAPEFAGKAEYANPEEMLAAALASCHMLTFLAIAAKSRVVVDEYEDEPEAVLDKNEAGQWSVTQIILNPRVRFGGDQPVSPDKVKALHDKAHKNCFIANSIKSQVGFG